MIALGGNALGNTPKQQLELVRQTASTIVDLIEEGYDVVVGHGNGPQVGMVNLAFENSFKKGGGTPEMPFPECGAMSQGYIGYHLQNALENEFTRRGMDKDVCTVVTQVLVDESDPAFENPTKPIGNFYDREVAEKIMREKGYRMVEDAGRGYRRVVPSPIPVDVVEKRTIKKLVDGGSVVIAVGGGGIPVVRRDGLLYGVPAVIDKDYASEKLAEIIEADILIILTAVEKVAINFGKPDRKWLSEMTVEEAERYAAEGQFAPGSMLPKVKACVNFAKSRKGRVAMITSLDRALQALNGETGTRISL